MKQLLILVAGLTLVLGIGGAAGGQVNTTNGLTQLTDAELKALLPGADLVFVNPARDAATLKSFGCDGEWAALGGRASRSGGYSIRGGTYCSAAKGGENRLCSKVFRDVAGSVFVQGVLPPPAVTPLREVRVDRMTSTPACSK